MELIKANTLSKSGIKLSQFNKKLIITEHRSYVKRLAA